MEGSTGVLVWWGALIAASVLNLALWGWTAKRDGAVNDRRQIWLSLIFTGGCAFRSWLPRAEASRICLYDSVISSASITRAVATVAELCFAAQCALILHALASDKGSRFGVLVSYLAVPMIAVAELASWYSALTANYFGSVIEESIWATTAALFLISVMILISRSTGKTRAILIFALIAAGGYFTFMCTVDVPMYWSRWRADEARGTTYLSVSTGWADASTRSVVTRRWEDWVHEMPWMTLYFTAGVWLSISMMRVREALRR